MLIVYKNNKATGVTYADNLTEYYDYHRNFGEYCALVPDSHLEYDEYGNCITELTFDELKEAKKYDIASKRYSKQSSDLYIEEFNATFFGNKEAQADLTREIAALEDAIAMGFWDENVDSMAWKTINGFVAVNLLALKKIRLYFSQRTQYIFAKENALIEQINNAATIDELFAIEWTD